ncbi:MAG: aldo/keto reductase [Planctomycetota bacterium]
MIRARSKGPGKKETVPRRRLGRTGLMVPVIPVGTQAFSNVFKPISDDDAMGLMRHAVDIGLNHFDCSMCYGDSMRRLALALRDGVIRRDQVIITGRLCCHGKEPWLYTAARAEATVQAQLDLLGMDRFDGMLIHDPQDFDAVMAPGGALDGLHRLKERGLVGAVGLGMSPIEWHLRAIAADRLDLLLFFGQYSLLGWRSAEPLLAAAAAKDVGVMNGWSIMRGLLTGADVNEAAQRGNVAAHASWADHIKRANEMLVWCRHRGVHLLPLALQFCLREERIAAHPIAPQTMDEMNMNVWAVSQKLPDGIFDELVKHLQ